MQGCFRQYPEIYGSELDSDADDDEESIPADAVAESSTSEASAQTSSDPLMNNLNKNDAGLVPDTYRPSDEAEPAKKSEDVFPKAAHDATDAVAEKK